MTREEKLSGGFSFTEDPVGAQDYAEDMRILHNGYAVN